MQIVSNLEVGGAQEVVRTLAENLSKNGCVSVVCTFKDGPLSRDIEELGIPVEILPERKHSVLSFFEFIKEMLGYRKLLRDLVEKYQIDVIQTHILRSMDFLVLSVKSKTKPKIFWTFHNSLFDLREDHLAKHHWLLKPKRFSHHLLYWLGSKRVDGIVAVSTDVKTAILETMFGIPNNKISVIRNCVDLDRYNYNLDRNKVRKEIGIGANDQLGIVVATFKRQKGHQYLIEAAKHLRESFPNLNLIFVGDGELRDPLERQVKELGLQKSIHFLGTRSDVPALLAASDLFVLPSLWEGLPMALIEAMASGLPVIATKVSGTNEVMVDGKTGILVEPGKSDELVTAIGRLLENPIDAECMGRESRKRVEKLFSAKKQALDYIGLFSNNINLNGKEILIKGR
jgi:glycosyltransferase involved in cell wall biosynthesis